MNIEKHQEEIRIFLDKKFDEIKKELGMPIHGGTIGTSFDDSKFDRIPNEMPVKLEGFFVDVGTGKVHAEVMSYSRHNGLVVINATNPDQGVIEPILTTIDYPLFAMLFIRTPVVGVVVE